MDHMPSSLRWVSFSRSAVALLTALLVFGLLPFAGALEVHHAFAAVDHDGHEHSDFDLCQWVQKHTSGSLVLHPPASDLIAKVTHDLFVASHDGYSAQYFLASGSRAPPALSV